MPRPKSKSQTDPERLKADINANRKRQYSEITVDGFLTEYPCDHCRRSGLDCVMNSDSKNSKCAACTYRGRPCEKRFHSEIEWRKLKDAELQKSSEIEENEQQIEAIHIQLMEAMAKAKRLRKEQKLLKERGLFMREHNRKVLEILDSENPPSDAEVAAIDAEIMQEQLESHVLAATSEELDAWLANPEQFPDGLMGAVGDTFLELPQLPQGSQ
jgi:hypothetical protein